MTVKKRNVAPQVFKLTNINLETVISESVGGDVSTEIETSIDIGVQKKYTVNELLHEKNKYKNTSKIFLDPRYKTKCKFWACMIDKTQAGPLPLTTSNPCWWCRSTFTTIPMGCPVAYNKECKDELYRERILEKFAQTNISLDDGTDFFETEGIFCSFPCTKSYIMEQISKTRSGKYTNALTLLSLLHNKLTGSEVLTDITSAPSWKLLSEWGGHLTPDEFRSSVNQLSYTETSNTKRPLMYSCSQYIQEKRVRV